MQLIRIIGNYYHKGKRRFTHRCFRNYIDGISVINKNCIESKYKHSNCYHIGKYYETKTRGNPIVFWCFDLKILGGNVDLKYKKSKSGDECHYDIIGLSNDEAKKIYQLQEQKNNLNLKICLNGNEQQLIIDQHHDLLINRMF